MIPVRAFYDLFQGNPDAYGQDVGKTVMAVRGSSQAAIHDHLAGRKSIGIYPMHNNFVHWGCTDIDTGSWDEAQTMWKILDRMGLEPHIEISRSKGYHVWSFASGWVPAKDMRRAFLYAHYVSKQINQPVEASEINPKAEAYTDEELKNGKLGNFVRLPYFSGKPDENNRRSIVDWKMGSVVPLDSWLPTVRLVAPATYREWADKWREPKGRPFDRTPDPDAKAEVVAQKLNVVGRKIFYEGVPQWDTRRSQTLVRLAFQCRASGLTFGEAVVVVADLNERLGKWKNPKYVESAVEWAYSRA